MEDRIRVVCPEKTMKVQTARAGIGKVSEDTRIHRIRPGLPMVGPVISKAGPVSLPGKPTVIGCSRAVGFYAQQRAVAPGDGELQILSADRCLYVVDDLTAVA